MQLDQSPSFIQGIVRKLYISISYRNGDANLSSKIDHERTSYGMSPNPAWGSNPACILL